MQRIYVPFAEICAQWIPTADVTPPRRDAQHEESPTWGTHYRDFQASAPDQGRPGGAHEEGVLEVLSRPAHWRILPIGYIPTSACFVAFESIGGIRGTTSRCTCGRAATISADMS